jgi:two-component system chemotaxis response regulator CheY
MQILIVDDSKAMRMILIRTLRQAGFTNYQAAEAGDGAEALHAVQASKPDLILSDWNMPKVSGLELLTTLNKSGCKVKFGFVTSESTPEMRVAAMQAGALFLLTKPFTPARLQEVLAPIMRA